MRWYNEREEKIVNGINKKWRGKNTFLYHCIKLASIYKTGFNVYNFLFSSCLSVRPESGPEIIGLRPEYNENELIDVFCTSAKSYPASQLDFFINDEPVSLKQLFSL